MPPKQNKSHEDVVVPILQEIGTELKQNFGKAEIIDRKTSSADSFVTALDQKTEKFIAERLHAYDPSIAFYGEEFGGDRKADRFWLLDPIDGTTHFVRGNPFCTTMLALIEDGEVTFSAINDFVRDDMYIANKDQGATQNGRPIHVSDRPLNDAYLAYEVNFTKPDNLQSWLKLGQECILFNTIDTGFEFAMVASGHYEGRICLDPFGGLYDFPAGAFLVAEAGGVVKNIGSDSYDYENFSFTATNPIVYQELIKNKLLPG